MTEKNQKKLYLNFKRLSVEGKTPKQREECGKYAAEILKSFPQFEVKVKTKPKEVVKPNSKEK